MMWCVTRSLSNKHRQWLNYLCKIILQSDHMFKILLICPHTQQLKRFFRNVFSSPFVNDVTQKFPCFDREGGSCHTAATLGFRVVTLEKFL